MKICGPFIDARLLFGLICLAITPLPQTVRATTWTEGKAESESPAGDGVKPVDTAEPEPKPIFWLSAADPTGSASTDDTASESSSVPSATPLSTWTSRIKPTPWLAATQSNPDQQPLRWSLANQWLIRFDGVDDCLHLPAEPPVSDRSLDTEQMTVFWVAAPHSNPGDFRAFFASHRPGQRDYESGLNVDLGPGPSLLFDTLNVEGAGFSGARNLSHQQAPFGQLQVFELVVDGQQGTVELWIDGEFAGRRDCAQAERSLAAWTIGARHYTNGLGPQEARGFLAFDLAEIIAFDQALTLETRIGWRQKLLDAYRPLRQPLADKITSELGTGIAFEKAGDPAPIQMLQAGFAVDPLPVDLTNINNVRYRRDGALVALGYNGDLYLLRDRDGDGLEEHVSVFWKNEGSIRGPIGMVLTPDNYESGQGVFIASKGKVSLIVDHDADDIADQEIIVASGWEEIPQAVDATGLAIGPDGSLYFGLGTANFANGYLIDEQGTANYDLGSERGTVQKISPNFKTRTTLATGIRFPIAFAFNELGDLFCTDQEGATWLANGNPLDELLHIPLDRGADGAVPHYGFPPRHPVYNPNVIDEPSVYNFGPQHQSTCGMIFNHSSEQTRAFGPEHWLNHALICGESRGKLWRTQLHKSPVGYLAETQLIACLQMLTIDCCLSPAGDLIVACHSGPPDWGTGPLGSGKLFRIRMIDAKTPRPIAAWAAGPQEIRIAFDQPLAVPALAGLQSKIQIIHGKHVRAGDRFENLVPPYAVVQHQWTTPRFELPVLGLSLAADQQTLILNTNPMDRADHYSIRLDGLDGATEVDLSLNGVQASWVPSNSESSVDSNSEGWSGQLPHLDLQASHAWRSQSAGHAELWKKCQQEGLLTLETIIDLRHLLRPTVQEGERLDYQLPPEEILLGFHGAEITNLEFATPDWYPTAERQAHEARLAQVKTQQVEVANGPSHWLSHFPPSDLPPVYTLRVTLRTGGNDLPLFYPSFSTAEDGTRRPLQADRFLVPWAPAPHDLPGTNTTLASTGRGANQHTNQRPSQLAEGNWGRGRRVFHSDNAQCYKCHRVGADSGGEIGPDLGNLVQRDYESVVRDIAFPSYSINPDYISHLIELEDGRQLTGVLRTVDNRVLLGDLAGNVTELAPDAIARIQPAATSTMPDHLWQKLTALERTDLLTYLLTPPPHMPLDSPLKAPPVRTRQEVANALADSQPLPATLKPLKLVLVDGVKDHGPGEHDYPAWQRIWGTLLAGAPNVEISFARDQPNEQQWAEADGIIFFQKGGFRTPRPEHMDRFLKRGGGLVMIHWAVNGDDQVKDLAKRIGFASWGGKIKYRHGPLTLDIRQPEHPIVRNYQQLQMYDESYWELTGESQDVTVLATSTEDGVPTPQLWTRDHDPGRVFVSIPGHYSWSFDDPLFRILLLRGLAWSMQEPIDRFNELVPLGARIQN